MGFSEVSPFLWLLIGIIALVSAGVITLFAGNLMERFSDEIQGNDAVPVEIQQQTQQRVEQTQSVLDYAFLGLFFTLALAVILVARSTTIEPFWSILLYILLVVVTIISAWFSNLGVAVDAYGSLGMSTMFPIMYHIINNAVGYVIAIGVIALMFARSSASGRLGF